MSAKKLKASRDKECSYCWYKQRRRDKWIFWRSRRSILWIRNSRL